MSNKPPHNSVKRGVTIHFTLSCFNLIVNLISGNVKVNVNQRTPDTLISGAGMMWGTISENSPQTQTSAPVKHM